LEVDLTRIILAEVEAVETAADVAAVIVLAVVAENCRADRDFVRGPMGMMHAELLASMSSHLHDMDIHLDMT
jgi:hypothetical protein